MDGIISISSTELRKESSRILNQVHYGKVPVIITRRGQPLVLMLPVIGKPGQHTNLREMVTAALETIESS